MTRPPVRVRIDRLVLEGIAPADRRAVVRAFEGELARLLQSATLPADSRTMPALARTLPAAGSPQAAGVAAAVAVAQAIGGRR